MTARIAHNVLDAAATLIKNVAGFTSTNVAVADYRVLDKGVTRAAILERSAPFEHGPNASPAAKFNAYSTTHYYLIKVFRKYKDDGTTYTDLLDDSDAIVAEIDKYPRLNATTGVLDAYISSGGEIYEILDPDAGKGPYFLMQQLTLTVIEDVTVSFLE